MACWTRRIVALGALMWGVAQAQDAFPQKPIRMIVVYPAGGGGDVLARALGETISKATGQPFIVENKGGASGMIGTAACKGAPPDGYTYCMVLSDVVTINPYVFKKVPYDADKDLVPVALVADFAIAIMTPSSVPARNLGELAALAKTNPGKLNWASFGVGTSSHLLLAQYNRTFNVDIQHVPYQGAPPILTALQTKEADVSLVAYGLVAQYIDQGKFRPIALMGTKRAPQMPNVPTLAEQGLDFKPNVWYGILGPAGIPQSQVEQMNKLVNQALIDPALSKRLQDQGYVPSPSSPSAFSERIKKDRVEWATVARELKLSLD